MAGKHCYDNSFQIVKELEEDCMSKAVGTVVGSFCFNDTVNACHCQLVKATILQEMKVHQIQTNVAQMELT